MEIATNNSSFTTEYIDWNMTTTSTAMGSEVVDIEFELPLLICICVFGLLGNALVCLVYTKQKFRQSNAAMYILNLATTDLLGSLVVLFHVTEFYHSTWPVLWAFNIQCQFHRYFRFVAFNSTVFTMMAIAIDRYFAVRNPLLFKVKFTINRTKFILAFIWLSSLLTALPDAFMFESIYSGEGEAVSYPGKLPWACKAIVPFGPWWSDFKPVYINILLFYVPAIITAVIYVRIVVHVKRSNDFLQKTLVSGGSVPKRHRNSHWKICKSLLYVFVGFITCFAPFATYNIVQQYFATALHPELKNLSLLLPYVNTCFNPIIYSFTNDAFWEEVKQILCYSMLKGRSKASMQSNDLDCDKPSSLDAISGTNKSKHVDDGDDEGDDHDVNGTMSNSTSRSSEYCMTAIHNGNS